jgi:glycine/D-amino acid oxidase-like deaminating enzyme
MPLFPLHSKLAEAIFDHERANVQRCLARMSDEPLSSSAKELMPELVYPFIVRFASQMKAAEVYELIRLVQQAHSRVSPLETHAGRQLCLAYWESSAVLPDFATSYGLYCVGRSTQEQVDNLLLLAASDDRYFAIVKHMARVHPLVLQDLIDQALLDVCNDQAYACMQEVIKNIDKDKTGYQLTAATHEGAQLRGNVRTLKLALLLSKESVKARSNVTLSMFVDQPRTGDRVKEEARIVLRVLGAMLTKPASDEQTLTAKQVNALLVQAAAMTSPGDNNDEISDELVAFLWFYHPDAATRDMAFPGDHDDHVRVTAYAFGLRHSLLEWVRKSCTHHDMGDLMALWLRMQRVCDAQGRALPILQEILYVLEDEFYPEVKREEDRARFQGMVGRVGGKFRHTCLVMPLDKTPFWHVGHNELEDFRSQTNLPTEADIVIVGAGLTGASAAYHLTKLLREQQPRTPLRIVVLEGDSRPAAQASGRNGGNFQLLQEAYIGTYDGLEEERCEWLRILHPDMAESEIRALATQQAACMLDFTVKNWETFVQLVREESIDCDYSPAGWLRIPSTKEEETAMIRDVEWVGAARGPKEELWTPRQVRERTGLPASYRSRFIAENGNYHPYKFVTGVLQVALKRDVELYTNVRVVEAIQNKNGAGVRLSIRDEKTGDVQELCVRKSVIFATNAFTSQVFPQLPELYCVPSQILNMEHVADRLNGITATEAGGDLYFNIPQSRSYDVVPAVGGKGAPRRRGMLHYGLDSMSHYPPHEIETSRELFDEMVGGVEKRWPGAHGQPPSRMWVGPMCLTPDRTPMIGFLDASRPTKQARVPRTEFPRTVVIAAGYQGYGGSFCAAAGLVAASMALTGEEHPSTPVAIFSPNRFLVNAHPTPLQM